MSAVSRLRKLRSMSGRELRTRLAAVAYRAYERQTLRGDPAVPSGAAVCAPSKRSVSSATERRARFLPSVVDLAAAREVLQTCFAEQTRDTIVRADRLIGGEVTLFGQQRRVDEDIDWLADPKSGRRWPLLYHRDVPIGDRSKAPGDAKDVWELNRHQFLIDLAKASLVTGRSEYEARLHRLIASWIRANPYARGVNWSGPLEVAYRALSWTWVYCLTGDRGIPPVVHDQWLGSFYDHGRFLLRHLELFESPFNHLIGEASVLFVLGTLFPEFDEAARWRALGRQILEGRLPQQFYPDGGSVEQATVYHHATTGFYLLAAQVARTNQQDLSPAVWAALERAIEHSMHLTQPDGVHPAA
jgi:hypothetical protein